MKNILLILFFLIASNLAAQNYFNHTFGDGVEPVNSGKVIETSDGFLVFGFKFTGLQEFYAKKLDIAGEEVFTKTLLIGDLWGWERPHNCLATSDGNYVLSINERVASGDFETVLFKIDDEADIIWTHRFTATENLSYDVIGQISELSDASLLITGAAAEIDTSGAYIGHSKALIIETDSMGEMEWMQIIEEPLFTPEDVERHLICYSHLEMPNGNILLACNSCELEEGAFTTCDYTTRVNLLIQLDPNTGEIIEENIIDDYWYLTGPLIIPIDEEHFLLSQIGPIDDDLDYMHSWVFGKYTYEGELVWEQYYPNDFDGPYFYPNRYPINILPVIREDGSFVALFKHTDGYLDEEGLYIIGTGSALAVFNPGGEWENTIVLAKDTTIASEDSMFDIERTSDGGYVLAGYTNPQSQVNSSKAWVVKMDSSFTQCAGYPCDSIVVGVANQDIQALLSQQQHLQLYPNPAQEMINIQWKEAAQNKAILRFRHLNGVLALKYPITDQKQLDISQLKAGLYVWELVQDQAVVQTGKIVVEMD